MAKPTPALHHHADGTPSVLRKPTVYTELFFYQKGEVLVQLTKVFCDRFLPAHGDRTVDQMVQAARSVTANIAEGLTDGQTSFEVEIKLLGIAQGSLHELMRDYNIYLTHHHLPDWGAHLNARNSRSSRNSSDSSIPPPPKHPRYDAMLSYCRSHNHLADFQPFFSSWTDEEMANTALCLCHIVDRMMASFIEKRDREFVEEGGIRERMTAARLAHRETQKQTIARQQAEIEALKAEITRLKELLAQQT